MQAIVKMKCKKDVLGYKPELIRVTSSNTYMSLEQVDPDNSHCIVLPVGRINALLKVLKKARKEAKCLPR